MSPRIPLYGDVSERFGITDKMEEAYSGVLARTTLGFPYRRAAVSEFVLPSCITAAILGIIASVFGVSKM